MCLFDFKESHGCAFPSLVLLVQMHARDCLHYVLGELGEMQFLYFPNTYFGFEFYEFKFWIVDVFKCLVNCWSFVLITEAFFKMDPKYPCPCGASDLTIKTTKKPGVNHNRKFLTCPSVSCHLISLLNFWFHLIPSIQLFAKRWVIPGEDFP